MAAMRLSHREGRSEIDPAMRLRLNAVAPLRTATLTVELEDESAVLGQLLELLRI